MDIIMEHTKVLFCFFCDPISSVHEMGVVVIYRTPAVGVVIRLATLLYACVNIQYRPCFTSAL